MVHLLDLQEWAIVNPFAGKVSVSSDFKTHETSELRALRFPGFIATAWLGAGSV